MEVPNFHVSDLRTVRPSIMTEARLASLCCTFELIQVPDISGIICVFLTLHASQFHPWTNRRSQTCRCIINMFYFLNSFRVRCSMNQLLNGRLSKSGRPCICRRYFPPGTYIVNDTLVCWFHTNLVGSSKCKSTIRLAKSSAGFDVATPHTSLG